MTWTHISTLSLVSLLALAGCGRQPTETRPVGAYSRVDADTSSEIRMIGEESDGPREPMLPERDEIGVNCDGDGEVDAFVEDGVLYVTGDASCVVWLRADRIESLVVRGHGEVTGDDDVTFGSLAEIDVAGTGDVSLGAVHVPALDIEAGGTGSVTIGELYADELSAHLRGSGDVTLAGEVDHAYVEITGSGDLHAAELVIGDLDIEVSGSGTADVFVTGTVNADVSGSGSITVAGGATVIGDLTAGL